MKKNTKTTVTKRRILVQLPPDLEEILREISELTGVPITKLIVDCVVNDKGRFQKMLKHARKYHQAITEDRPEQSNDS